MLLKASQVELRLAETERALQFLLRAILPTTDSRFDHVSELLHVRIWKAHAAFPLEQLIGEAKVINEEFKVNGDLVYNETSAMQGRVLTLIDAVFPSGQQCEAIKSEAKPLIWSFYNNLRIDDSENA